MSELNLPLGAKIDLPALCRNDSNYRLTLPQSLFTRLADSCAGLRSDATLEVHFYRDLQGLNTLEGTIAITIDLICERCLQPFSYELNAKFKSTCDLAKVKSLRLEDKLDVVDLAADGMLDFYNYLEDCLLLELPIVPRHADEADCGMKGDSWAYGADEIPAKENPFAVLKDLQRKS
ncbi:MAG: DUF177 domain-containing protein [Candidatus Anaerobiospirillum merdipullorum]|uniref:Large ribosomal RNA subunit accumulation protein YceD n=1 Tax=Candidatus Anaerobiospirillum merdipullorum TaxID=2838450 RepID=A0A9E2KNF4_9GAMM|nr:DUF177 domain-containing protein [Candidatus Anaerobiospirillum merdipullorum]